MTTLFKDTVVYEVYGETIAVGDLLYKSTGTGSDSGRTAGRLYKLDVNDKDRDIFYGIAKDAGNAGDTNRRVVTSGRFDGYTMLTAGTALYADRAVPGAVTAIRPSSKAQFVGIAIDSDTITVNAALAGTFGAGGGNTIVEAIAGENLSARDAVYLSVGAADGGRIAGRAYKLQANDDNRIEYVGLVADTVLAGAAVEITTAGVVESFTGLSVGEPVYLAPDTAGAFTQIDPDDPTFFNRWVIRLGTAVSDTLVLVNPDQASSAFFQSAVQADILIANNQVAPANLTNLVFDGETTNNFRVGYTLTRSSSLESYAQTGELRGVYNTVTNTWFMSDNFTGENAGVSFTITNLGQIQYTSSNLTGTGYVGTFEYNILLSGGVSEVSSTIPRDNLIINGNFDFWQRGTSLAAATGPRFLADRWVGTATGSTSAQSRQAFVLGQQDVPNNPEFYHRTVVSSVAGAGNSVIFAQRIEGVETLSGRTATVSFWAKADSNKPVSIELAQVFGTGGTPSAPVTSIGVKKVNLTASWQKITHTVSIPSVAGKTLGTNNNDQLALILWFDAGSNFAARSGGIGQQSGTFDIAQVKLEEGSVATPFVLAGRTLAGELENCQRFYEKSYDIAVTPGSLTAVGRHEEFRNQTTGINQFGHVSFKTKKRGGVTPVIYDDAAGAAGNVTQDNGSSVAGVIGSVGQSGFRVSWTNTASRFGAAFHWTADAEL